MPLDDRDLLDVLRAELAFLDTGGYEREVPKWRTGLIFEDSPTCLNHNDPARRRACTDCLLAHLVPREARFATVPCRYISLNEDGVTLNDLYNSATNDETQQIVRRWLRNTIAQLEQCESVSRQCGNQRSKIGRAHV